MQLPFYRKEEIPIAVQKEPFGVTASGGAVEKITLSRGALSAEVITYGAALRALWVPGPGGAPMDVVLGYDSIAGYEENGCYLGAVIGRYGNRIAGARCTLDGEALVLVPNEGTKQLHGGPDGFDRKLFQVEEVGEDHATLCYTSPDGEGGFPGTLTLRVTYTLTDSALRLRYRAVSDKATYCNITNHSYFNLNGGGDVMGHRLWLASHQFTPVDADSIPTALSVPVAGTPFDFTAEKPLGQDVEADDRQLRNVGGYDHHFVLDPAQGLRLAARLTGERGVSMETWTQMPGLQLYTGNFLETTAGKGGGPYKPRQAVCLETQYAPDSPNHPEWGDIVLRPGQVYDMTTEYRFTWV